MAQRVVVHLGCDLEDGKASETVQTVSFGFQGNRYELELCSRHRATLDKLMNAVVPYSRRLSPSSRRSATKSRTRPASQRDQSAAIREWAQENGIKVSGRGRIPAHVSTAFEHRDDVPVAKFSAV